MRHLSRINYIVSINDESMFRFAKKGRGKKRI